MFEFIAGFLVVAVSFAMIATGLILKNKPVMLIEIEKRHSGIDPQIVIDEIKSFGYQCLYVNDDFDLNIVNKVKDISNHNFIFIPE